MIRSVVDWRSIPVAPSCPSIIGFRPRARSRGPVDDCFNATNWVVENAAQLRVDASRIAVAGDSAGGHLSLAVSLKARDHAGPPISLQTLLYPVVDPDFETESYHLFADGYGLTRETMRWFWEQFLGSQPPSPLATPLLADSFAGLPPAILVTAEYDVLRDEGVTLFERLRGDGVEVEYQPCDGMLHGFIHFAGFFENGLQVGQSIARQIGERLRSS